MQTDGRWPVDSTRSLVEVTRDDLAELGDLTTLEPTLVAAALRLAKAIDEAGDEAVKALPALVRELRATLDQIAAGRRRAEAPTDDEFGDLDDPE
jgi:hypothetical protein